MKKLSVILLGTLLCLCLALLPTETQAAETEGYLTYTITDGEVTITDCDEDATGKIVIPDTIEGYPVTKILGYTFSSCDSITSITIPAGVKEIGTLQCVAPIWVDENNPYLISDSKGVVYSKDMKTLFGVPASLTGVYTIPGGVQTIETRAFATCENLTQIILPESVTVIEAGAFAWCTKLESVNIPTGVQSLGGMGGYLFKDCSSLKSITIPYGVTEIPDSTFQGCTALEIAELPDTITKICFEAFECCTSLKTVNLSYVTTIEEMAFDGCTNLDNITLAEGLLVINDSVFRGCSSLSSIQIPSTVTEIGFHAFWNCTGLLEINIPASVVTLADAPITQNGVWVAAEYPNYVSDSEGVLYSKDMTVLYGAPKKLSSHYTIPNGVVEIKSHAFSGCKNLTGVDVPDSVTAIGSYAFSYSGLTEVPVFQNATTEYGIFRGCTDLVSITIPDGVQEISTYTFADCTSLTTVRLPAGLQKIGMHAFQNCTALKEVYSYASKGAIEIDNSVKTNDYLLNAEWIVHECTWEEINRIEPTCMHVGTKEYTCTECGRILTESIRALRHEIEDTWNVNDQRHWRACTNCAYKQNWANHIPGPEATEDAAQICTVCGFEIAPKLEKEEPTYWIWIVVGAVILAGGATATVIILKKKRQ